MERNSMKGQLSENYLAINWNGFYNKEATLVRVYIYERCYIYSY